MKINDRFVGWRFCGWVLQNTQGRLGTRCEDTYPREYIRDMDEGWDWAPTKEERTLFLSLRAARDWKNDNWPPCRIMRVWRKS